jgi:hypothetical protein
MLAVRKSHPAFGRGTLKFLYPGNRKVFAYLRELTGDKAETVLCVCNLSRTAQAVELDLSAYIGRVPVDIVGGSVFPPVGQLTYLLTLPPYGSQGDASWRARRCRPISRSGAGLVPKARQSTASPWHTRYPCRARRMS